jgi:hypothetical protein
VFIAGAGGFGALAKIAGSSGATAPAE